MDLFLESMKSEKTRTTYRYALDRFVKWTGITGELKDLPAQDIQDKLIEFTIYSKTKTRSWQNIVISAVQKYCEAFDIELRFKKVRNYLNDDETNTDDRPYTVEEVQKLLDASDIRKKAVILLLTSSGIRADAVHTLRIKDLTKIENVFLIWVYATSKKSRYYVLTTPEATQALEAYLHYREINGETILPTSPLIREEFNPNHANKPKALTTSGLNGLILRLLRKNGFRTGKKDGRYEVHQMHGFRKLFRKALYQGGVKDVVTKKLMGQSIGLDHNYLRLDTNEVVEEYRKAIPFLTISPTAKQALKIRELQSKEQILVTALKKQNADYEARLRNLEQSFLYRAGKDLVTNIEKYDITDPKTGEKSISYKDLLKAHAELREMAETNPEHFNDDGNDYDALNSEHT